MESDRPATFRLHNKEPKVNDLIGADACRSHYGTTRPQTASVAVVTETPPASDLQVKFLQGPRQVAVLVAGMAELDQGETFQFIELAPALSSEVDTQLPA
jgi:hypothetical protein